MLTYEGPKIDVVSKTREELETALGDAEYGTKILEKLGFRVIGAVRRVRKNFKLESFKVCLDRVDGLGEFVEVECEGGEVGELHNSALKILRKLDLDKRGR